jgi:CubicO group peptidase (beta-lactamase class C family)
VGSQASVADEQASAEFTIEDLLSHRSGLPGFAADSLVETGWAAKEVYQVLDKIPLKDPFRSVYNYQNIYIIRETQLHLIIQFQ